MFCSKCGAQVAEGDTFCQACGQRIDGTGRQIHTSIPIKDNQVKKHRIIGIAAVSIIVVIVLILGMILFGGRSEKDTVKKYVEGQLEGDGKKLINLFPEELIDGICQEEGYLNKKEMIAEVNEQLEKQLERVEDTYGNGWEYSYEVIETEDYPMEDLREMRQDYQEDYGVELEIEEAKEVKIEITTSSKDGENSTTNTIWVDIIKIGNSWYISGI